MKKFKRKWLLASMLILLVSLVITGCTTDVDSPDDTQTGDPDVEDKVDDAIDDTKDAVDDTAEDVEDDLRDMTYEDIKVTPEDVFDKFMELHPEAKIKKVNLDKELTEYQYVVEGYDIENEYEVKINPVDGSIISDDLEVIVVNDENAEITKDHLAKVDNIIDKAKIEDGSDSRLDEWNVSAEDSKVIMHVEIGATKYSYDMETEELIK